MQSSNEPKVGDVVTLKSGGQRMTIASINNDLTFICHWFDSSGNFKTAYIEGEALRVVQVD